MRDRVATAPRRPRDVAVSTVSHLVLAAGALLMVFPFAWQALTSVKTYGESILVPPTMLPEVWDLANYAEVFDVLPFGQMFVNTVLMTLGRTIAQLVFCALAAYAFARLRFPGRDLIFIVFLSVLMVPGELFLLPQFQIMSSLGWLNTLQALIVPGMFNAFGTFLLRQYFLTLPMELDEAAELDGCNPWRSFWHVTLPLASPALVTLAVLAVLYSWNDLMWPLIVNTRQETMTLTVGLATLQGDQITDYPVIMAGSVMATIPILIVFILLQRRVIEGIAFSGLKG
ncbi:carbohydrate ABC transporter permease [Microbacterium esteraromaticum]|uniref:Carbohydrate ABC transporter permease n=1 Tax=Microbacterium esteraromaticum TaxID=57043 RepID=A0A7D7W755_9MICO|nr:carbohydrate ABC transporter permease [Microbacterium esteraromaticum]QMU96876.1 carbohydrate ABC transporter permease [Microbacterium esteraromaticum]